VSGARDPYEILQVRPDASDDVIRAAYRALARRYHPDTSADVALTPQMVTTNAAWEILGNPERRARYDREHGLEPRATIAEQEAHPRSSWDRPGGAAPSAGTNAAGADAGPTAAGAGTGATPGAGAGAHPGFGGGRPPIQRRGADGRVIEWRNAPDGTGGAGEPPGRPTGTILPFGRFIAWSIGEIARRDPGYLEWLDQRPEGAPYRAEIDATLKHLGWRQVPGSRVEKRLWGR
jgi:curved DNA-binding protein CbpA